MNSEIVKISYFLPERVVTNKEMETEFPEWTSEKIEDKIGIKERHVTGAYETAADIGFNAATQLLKEYDKSKIDFLLFCTQSPDFFLPTSACVMQDRLGLNKSIGALDFNLGCSGFIYGLALAKGLISSGIASNVMLITSETYSKYIHPKDKANRTIFGDGAAATLVSKCEKEKIFEFDLGTDGSGMNNLIVANGAMRNRNVQNAPEKHDSAGNIYSDDNLFMNGPEIFNFTINMIPKTIKNCLQKNNLTLDQIDYVIFHQANKFMLSHLRRKLGINSQKFYINLEKTGNTVSATIPIALKDCLNSGEIKTGDKVLLSGFGVGYSWGTTIIEI
jgi:3-oxoacyl-[acyl-carrier-protein] synthase III